MVDVKRQPTNVNHLTSGLQISIRFLTSNSDISIISQPISMFNHSLQSSRRDDCNEWLNIEIG